VTMQCAEASTEGLMFSITHERKLMPSVDCSPPPKYMQEISLLLSRHLSPLNQFPERHSSIF
jgi:hypothetical protein